MFYKFHSKSPWLKRVLIPLWALQISSLLILITILIWLPARTGLETTNVAILIISALCLILSVTEIILYAATRLHPLTYLLLQLVKTVVWLLLFAVAVYKLDMLGGVKAEEEAGWADFFLEGFVETLVLFITFLATSVYASIVYHRHRGARARFFRSVQGKDLFAVIPDSEACPVGSHRVFGALEDRMGIKDMGCEGEVQRPVESKEALEVTVLRELGGDWEVYELPATRSVRNSRGGKSVKSFKGGR